MESWGCEKEAKAVLGDGNWPDQVRIGVDRMGKPYEERHIIKNSPLFIQFTGILAFVDGPGHIQYNSIL